MLATEIYNRLLCERDEPPARRQMGAAEACSILLRPLRSTMPREAYHFLSSSSAGTISIARDNDWAPWRQEASVLVRELHGLASDKHVVSRAPDTLNDIF